jgi:3-methyladenine DNA glycosylase AlkD
MKMHAADVASNICRDLESLPLKRTAPMRKVRRAYSKDLRFEAPKFIFEVAKELLGTGRHRWIAYELISDHPQAFRSLDETILEDLGHGIDSWWTVDSFARTVSGPAWRDGLITIHTIEKWARSTDRWWRRAALVSTVALNVRSHGGRGDVLSTLEICDILADDPDDMVVKAMSWALRELVVHDQEAVREFFAEHEHVLAPRVKREVMNKIETGLKNP